MAPLTVGYNTYKRSKHKMYEDDSLLYKLILFKKISPATKNLAYVQIRMG